MISEKSINKSEISHLNDTFKIYLIFTHAYLQSICHLHKPSTKFHLIGKYLNMGKMLRMGSKDCTKLSTWKNQTELFLSHQTTFSSPWLQQWRRKINFITKQHFQSQFSLFSIRADISQVFHDWSLMFIMSIKFSLAKWKKYSFGK